MKELGNPVTLTASITQPELFNALNMDYNKIMLLTGLNGSGKTFILKMTWILNTQMSHHIISSNHGISHNDKIAAQFLMDKSFDNNNITGEMSILYPYGNFITIKLDQGTVTDCIISIEEELEDPGQPIYMSKEMRLIGEMVKYIKFKELVGIPIGMAATEADMVKLCKMYKIYDIIYAEMLLHKIANELTPKILEEFNVEMQKFDEKFSITNLRIDHVTADILYSDAKVTDQSVSTFSAGHQALINMLLAQAF